MTLQPIQAQPYRLDLAQRWAILGETGTGKTTFVRRLIAHYLMHYQLMLPTYILDQKNVGDFKALNAYVGQVVDTTVPMPKLGIQHVGKPITLWHPDIDDLHVYDAFFEQVLLAARNQKMPSLVVVDEMSSITDKSGKATIAFERIEKQGRGLKIPLLGLTQSAAQIPFNYLRQASYIVLFTIENEYDQKILRQFFGSIANKTPKDRHGFYVRNKSVPISQEPIHYYPDNDAFFGKLV